MTFRAATAFAKQSGNYEDFIEAMSSFLENGGAIDLTFGADVFGRQTFGSEYEALKTLLDRLAAFVRFRLYLYHEGRRTFHPKIYLFSNEQEQRALIIVGSSNWSHGGLIENVEANVLVRLDLKDADHGDCYRQIVELFEAFWKETE